SALCLLLLFGIVYAEQSDQTPQSLLQASQFSPETLTASAATVSTPQTQNIFDGSFSNSAPVSLQPMFNKSFAQQVSFSFPGH
ncbi:MAG TPA: hypothetical protein VN516_05690, partial [Candidatus Baltobacteraceae bacterium]|nr:hypothetical protein [Candidatus Baltobacteraceae bacterium]